MTNLIITSASSLQGGAGTYAIQLSETLDGTFLFTEQSFESKKPILSKLAFFFRLTRHIRDNPVEYVILQSTFGLLCSIYLRLRFPSLPLINIYHGLASNYTYKSVYIIELISSWASTISVVTNLIDGNRLNYKDKQIYIPNCARPNLTTTFGAFGGQCVTVTRNSQQKDNLTLRAFLKETSRKVEIYAPKTQHSYFKEQFQFSNVRVKNGKMPSEIYAHKSMFILATKSEGFPLSILEAASYHLPILVSDIPVLRSILGDYALYFKSAAELVTLVEKCSIDPNYYSERQKASQQLTYKYSEELWRKRWASLLAQVGA